MINHLARFAITAALLLIVACSSDQTPTSDFPQSRNGPPSADAGVFGKGGFSLSRLGNGQNPIGDGDGGEGLNVNRHLWRASLDTLSFLPLISTDPFSGVIVTDWGATPNAPNERFKVTVYITDTRLRTSALKVVVFRETRDQTGAWVPAPVDADTASKLEDAILSRARQTRLAEAAAE